ncbi:MAG: 2-oxoacid:acceptor oxidoreductase family protein, partial [Chloroflexota bacterium]|nr:2-oxoacid:acceptor oxidoreductase family protein [Chloroflexota bacterium]
MRDNLTIGIAGAGGDGVVLLGSILQKLAASLGYFSQMPRYYGAQIRGGGSAVKLGLDAKHLALPGDSLDIIVCFDWQKYLEVNQELSLGANTIILYENEPTGEINLPEKSFQVAFSRNSQEITGTPHNKNIVALGVLLEITGISEEQVIGAITGDHEVDLLKNNLAALEAGKKLFFELSIPSL